MGWDTEGESRVGNGVQDGGCAVSRGVEDGGIWGTRRGVLGHRVWGHRLKAGWERGCRTVGMASTVGRQQREMGHTGGAGHGRGGTGCPWGREGTRGGDKNPARHRLNSALFTSHSTPGEGERGGAQPLWARRGHTQPQGTHTTPPTPARATQHGPPCTQTAPPAPITHMSPTPCVPAATVTSWGSPAQHGEGFGGGLSWP